MPGAVPPEVSKALATRTPAPSGLSDDESRAFQKLKNLFATACTTRSRWPRARRTLYGTWTPPSAGCLAHDLVTAMPSRGGDRRGAAHAPTKGQPQDQLTRDDVLDNITLYWLTNTGISSARLYWENKFPFFDFKNVTIPVAVTVFPGEFYQTPRSWAERAYPKLVHYNKLDKGGHFPAWEQPKLFVEELRAGLRSLRT